MFKPTSQPKTNVPANLPAPVGGLDASSSLMKLGGSFSIVSENFLPEPDALTLRKGYVSHVTGFAHSVDTLHTYSSTTGAETLWATTSDGVFAASTAGAVGAAAIALTNGKTVGVSISTGAGNYMFLVNGVDTCKRYDGTTWTSIAAFGTASDQYSYIELYRQRLFFVKKASLEIEYLGPNSIAGAATNYPLGAIFKEGGYIVAVSTWTIDGGFGPEDQLVIITNKGEAAVFAGSDPATWAYRGVYFIGRPLGLRPCYKYGGDLLVLTENGLLPMSSTVQSTSIDRIQTITQRVKPLIAQYAASAFSSQGWQVYADPLSPYLAVNLPITPVRKQLVMHSQTGAWTHYSGYNALCFGRRTGELYFGTANSVCRITGVSDAGANIVGTVIQAPSRLGYPRNKLVQMVRPVFETSGSFSYRLGIASNFGISPDTTLINIVNGSGAIWGTATWGSALWTAGSSILTDWETVSDEYSLWKGLYLQVSSNISTVSYIGCDFLMTAGGNF